MSIDYNTLPEEIRKTGQRTFRSILIEGEEMEFSGGFTELHTESYKHILAGNGFSVEDARSSINTVFDIRNAVPVGKKGDYHPFLKNF
jgi:UDP-N-acetyl-2-amino-2-deoxyglucuronate dehydrogenase